MLENKNEDAGDLVALKPGVLFVGAGPVGLWTAIQMKSKNPRLNVLMFEKHQSYSREQYLKLDFCLIMGNPAVCAALEQAIARGDAKVDDNGGSISIPVQILEKCLKSVAENLGIQTKYQNLASDDEIRKTYPDCPFVIGSDGYRSTIRKTVFGIDENQLPKHDLQYLIELKYQVKGKRKRMIMARYNLLQPFLRGFLADREHIKYDAQKNISEVTQRFIINKATYDHPSLAAAKAAAPLRLSAKIPGHLRTAISVWLNARGDTILVPSKNPRIKSQQLQVEEGILGPRLNKTILHIYKNERSYSVEKEQGREKRAWFLAGDSLIGLSFMKGLNTGLECGNKLADLVTGYWAAKESGNQGVKIEDLGLEYQTFAQAVYEKRRQEVEGINSKINLNRSLVKTTRLLTKPLSMSLEDVDLVKTDHPIFGKRKKKWPWFLGGFLLGAGLAAVTVLTFGLSLLPALALLIGGPVFGLLSGHRLWKWAGPYEDVESESSPGAAPDSPLNALYQRNSSPHSSGRPPLEPLEAVSDNSPNSRLNRQTGGFPGLYSPSSRPPMPNRSKPAISNSDLNFKPF